MNELHSNIGLTEGMAPSTVSATGTATLTSGSAAIIDGLGYKSVTFAIHISAVSAADDSNYLTFGIEEGDAANLSDAADAPAARVIGTAVVDATGDAGSVLKITVMLFKRYVRLKWTETGTFSGTFGAVAIKGDPLHAPAS